MLVAFPPETARSLAQAMSEAGWRQFHVAETEKYAHVTYFFNGGVETPWPGEDRRLIPSRKVATYDLAPEMSAAGVTDALVAAIDSGDYDFIVANYANPDMVGHTGVWDATIEALAVIDASLGRVVAAVERARGRRPGRPGRDPRHHRRPRQRRRPARRRRAARSRRTRSTRSRSCCSAARWRAAGSTTGSSPTSRRPSSSWPTCRPGRPSRVARCCRRSGPDGGTTPRTSLNAALW